MPDTATKTLRETLREVIGEPVKTSSTETNQGLSSDKSAETKSGDTPEFVKGVDISKLPEAERPIARKILEEKGGLLEEGYRTKFQEVAILKKQKQALLEAGISEQEAFDVLSKHLESKNTGSVKKEASKLIDKLKSEAPDLETRKGLENLENIILDLTNVNDLRKEISDLKNRFGFFQNTAVNTRQQSLSTSLGSLKKEYGEELIDKYHEEIVKQGLTYPDADPERLLHAIADPKELKQALLSNTTKKQERKEEKLNAISSPGSGITNVGDTVDIKKTPLKSILNAVFVKK